jgi:type II secretory pathway component GspD/PulD (secretin)
MILADKKSVLVLCSLLALFPLCARAVSPQGDALAATHETGFVARQQSIQAVFDALSSRIGKPMVLSRQAQKKQVSGDFDLSSAWGTLEQLSTQLSLIWYFDGQSIYVYDASEIKNTVVSLRHIQLKTLTDFLQSSGLYDKRYPLKGGAAFGPFYVSGPPVYVDIVVNAASYMDQRYSNVDLGNQKVAVIPLRNTFVSDRSYKLRDQTVTIPGIASVIQSILRAAGELPADSVSKSQPPAGGSVPPAPQSAPLVASDRLLAGAAAVFDTKSVPELSPRYGSGREERAVERIGVQPVPENNSLLIKGRPEQIEFIRSLVNELDVAKRHVELALWIIDISKNSFDALGVKWGASLNAGPLSLRVNGSQLPGTALDGSQFLADVAALNQKGQAEVVTRPVVLTQENVPAIFDHNQTFYTKVLGERTAQLDHVTYGTMISVLPRVSGDGNEIEMVLNIEDGSADNNQSATVDSMPLVSNTQISTVARVPRGKSLLVGGYTKNSNQTDGQKIPGLGDIPLLGGLFRSRRSQTDNLLRLFLIEPRVLENGSGWDADRFTSAQNPGSASSVLQTMEKLRRYLDEHALN